MTDQEIDLRVFGERRCAFRERPANERPGDPPCITLYTMYEDGEMCHGRDIMTLGDRQAPDGRQWRYHDVRRRPPLLDDSAEWIEVVWLNRCPDGNCKGQLSDLRPWIGPWEDERNPEGAIRCSLCGGVWYLRDLWQQTETAYHGSSYCDRFLGQPCPGGCQDA